MHKYETTVFGTGWTDFHETFTKRKPGKLNFHRHTQMGARPPNNSWGLKTTQCALLHVGTGAANDSEFVYAGSVLYGGCVKKA